MTRIEFTVHGVPKTAGSKRAFVNKKTGRAIITDDCKKGADWKKDIQQEAQRVYSGPLLHGPLRVSFSFTFQRPRSHYGTGKNAHIIKPSAPVFHTQTPDALKLARLVEDALTAVIWNDDRQIVLEEIGKGWAENGLRPGVHVIIEEYGNGDGYGYAMEATT